MYASSFGVLVLVWAGCSFDKAIHESATLLSVGFRD